MRSDGPQDVEQRPVKLRIHHRGAASSDGPRFRRRVARRFEFVLHAEGRACVTAGFRMRRLLRLANAPHAIVHHARFSASQASGLERGDKREERQRCRQHEPCTYLQCSDQLRLSFPPQRALSVPAGPTRGRPPRRPKPIPQPAGRPIRWPGRRLGGRDIVVLPSLGPLGAMHPPFRSLVNPPTIAMRESAGAPGAGARTPNIASERMRRHLPACWQAPTCRLRRSASRAGLEARASM